MPKPLPNTPLTILGNISAQDFLTHYWQKKPLLIRQGLPNFTPPISAEELAGLSLEEGVESRILQEIGPKEPWEVWHGPLSESLFRRLSEDKPWTLLVQAVDQWVPEVSQLKEAFHFIPSWRLDDVMISYANKGGSVGPHYDHYDVFLIQAQGKRQWQIGQTCSEDDALVEGPKVRILETFEGQEQYELEPGDILYLPPKVAHYGPALTDECMTISIGFRAPSHSEMFQEFSRYLSDEISDFERYEDGALALQEHPGEISAASLAQVKQSFLQYLEDPARLQDWFGRLMTEPKYPELEPPMEGIVRYDTLEQDLAECHKLTLDESCRLAFIEEPFTAFIDGESYELDASLKPVIHELARNRSLVQSTFKPMLTEEPLRALLVDWINRQKLLVE